MSDKPENVRVFAVNTRFQQLACRPGGVSRDDAISKAQTEINNNTADFADWVEQELQALSATFHNSRGAPIVGEKFETFYRLSCQLRDTGTTMGYALLTFVSDNLSRVLEAIRDGAPYDPAMIECHIDALTLARREPYRSMGPDHLPDMSRGLRRVLDLANRQATRSEH